MTEPPRPRLGDHLRVAWLFLVSAASVAWYVPWVLLSPVLRPWARARARARLRQAPVPPTEPPAPDPAAWEGKTVFVVAGEASGDLLGARVVRAIRARCPGVRLRGYGGPALAAAGVALDRDLVAHGVMGVVPVIRSLPFWWRVCAESLARWREDPPDLLLTVDFPGLNVRLAKWARRAGVRVVHLVAPHLWAHAPWRVLRWRGAVDRMLAMFPFEPALFEGSGVPTTFVGHPLFEAPLAPPRTPEAWPGAGPCTVELLPGSRGREIDAHVPVLLEAAADVAARIPGTTFVVRLAEERDRERYDAAAATATRRPERLRVAAGPTGEEAPLLGAMAASGTVTAELATALVPMTVFYRVGWLARMGAHTLFTSPWFCLANLVAGEEVVTERVFTLRGAAPRIAEDFLAVAGSAEAWTAQRARLAEVRRRLETPAVADRAARAALAS